MKTVHKAMFFRTEEDIMTRHAFVLTWMKDEEGKVVGFSINPPGMDDDMATFHTPYVLSAEDDFREMVRMMKLMINPVAVVIDGVNER